VTCGPDPDAHLEQAQAYQEAGYDELYVANMGPHYAGMIQLWKDKVLPQLRAG
jgi:hypothetical protein